MWLEKYLFFGEEATMDMEITDNSSTFTVPLALSELRS
jgi:hypothetical protein